MVSVAPDASATPHARMPASKLFAEKTSLAPSMIVIASLNVITIPLSEKRGGVDASREGRMASVAVTVAAATALPAASASVGVSGGANATAGVASGAMPEVAR